MSSSEFSMSFKSILLLALPLIANNAIQSILNITDTWFVGRVSVQAVAALSAANWPAILFIYLIGGVGVAVQTLSSHAYGAKEYEKSARYVWSGIGVAAITIPFFLLLAWKGIVLFKPFALDASLISLLSQWWQPRLSGAFLCVIYGCLTGFFNGVNCAKITFRITFFVAILNIVFNYFFIFVFKVGIAGSAWGTNLALLGGCVAGLIVFISEPFNRKFCTRKVEQPRFSELSSLLKAGLGIGIIIAADLLGLSIFQLMQTKLGVVEGAATQVVMTLTSLGYLPTLGIALAGTISVGQCIGAGELQKAYRQGNKVIILAMLYMAAVSLIFGLFSRELAHFFVSSEDAHAQEVEALVRKLIWFAAFYQIFDGLNIGSGFCLRGARDFIVPGRLIMVACFLVFIPLCHTFSFNAAQAWVPGMPQLGWGVQGGWLSISIYMLLVSMLQNYRWRSLSWQNKFIK